METVRINIDGKEIITQKDKTVLETSLEAGIYIPHLCYHPELTPLGGCRLCLVEIEGLDQPLTSCTTLATEGLVIKTMTDKLKNTRRLAMELLLAGHPADCGTCIKYLNCELQSLKQYLVSDQSSLRRRSRLFPVNMDNPLFVLDPNKCIVCGRCVRACREIRGADVLFYKNKGGEFYTGTVADLPLADSGCQFCGACAEVCPTGAIMDKEELIRGKNRKKALLPCKSACPAEIDVPRYLRYIRVGNYSAAAAVIREKVPFPLVLGYVCDQPCESVCRRGLLNQPVSIRELKRFAVEKDVQSIWQQKVIRKPATDKKVAIIGSGPTGLTAAYYLNNQGHSVTIFEAMQQAGGMLRYGIPKYRLPKEVLDREIEFILNSGIALVTGTRIESIDMLFEQGFNSVLVAIGTQRGQKLSIPGANHRGILVSLDLLKDLNSGKNINIGSNVIVLGGGNVAFDCARTALRCGASQVKIVCLESREEMPASSDEIIQGEQEGIEIYPSLTVTEIFQSNGEITGVECMDVISLSFDENNVPHIEANFDSRHILSGNTVIMAIGQRPEIPEGFGLNLSTKGLIEVDSYMLTTNKEGVYAAGDVVTGTASVIRAIAAGRKIASVIDIYLGGDGMIDQKLALDAEMITYKEPVEAFSKISRHVENLIPPELRVKEFCQVVQSLDEISAYNESGRCLECDLRLNVRPVKFWGSY